MPLSFAFFCITQDSVKGTSNREVSFHSITYISENKCTQLLIKGKDVLLTF